MPSTPEGYIHRVGRTARAGPGGIAVSLCDASEVSLLRQIGRVTGSPVRVIEDPPFHSQAIASLYSGEGKKSSRSVRDGAGAASGRGAASAASAENLSTG